MSDLTIVEVNLRLRVAYLRSLIQRTVDHLDTGKPVEPQSEAHWKMAETLKAHDEPVIVTGCKTCPTYWMAICKCDA